MTRKKILLVHKDTDGAACAVLVEKAFGAAVKIVYCTTEQVSSQVRRVLKTYPTGQAELWLADVSVSPALAKVMQHHHGRYRNMKLVDHHAAAKKLDQYPWAHVRTHHADGRPASAASLLYEQLVEQQALRPSRALAEFVEKVRAYDTYTFTEADGKDVYYLLNLLGFPAFKKRMLARLDDHLGPFSMAPEDVPLLQAEARRQARYVQAKSAQVVEKTIQGTWRCGIVMAEQYQSEVGNELNLLYPFLDAMIMVDQGKGKVAYRTIHAHVNVQELAACYGGGGHEKAAGSLLTKAAFQHLVVGTYGKPARKPDPLRNKQNKKGARGGVLYENGETSIWLRPSANSAGRWLVEAGGKRNAKEWDSYEEAEWHVKRAYGAWLAKDDFWQAQQKNQAAKAKVR